MEIWNSSNALVTHSGSAWSMSRFMPCASVARWRMSVLDFASASCWYVIAARGEVGSGCAVVVWRSLQLKIMGGLIQAISVPCRDFVPSPFEGCFLLANSRSTIRFVFGQQTCSSSTALRLLFTVTSKKASAVFQICRCHTAALETITRARICMIGPVAVNLLKRAPYHREGVVSLLDIVLVRLCWLLGGRPATRKKLVEVCCGGDCAVRSTDDVFNSVMKKCAVWYTPCSHLFITLLNTSSVERTAQSPPPYSCQ